MGSMCGGSLVKNGRKKMIILFSAIGIIGCGLSCVADTRIMCVGRWIYGFSAAILLVASSKIVSEIVPTKFLDKGYGVSTNLSINLFFALSFVLGSWVPTTEEEQQTS